MHVVNFLLFACFLQGVAFTGASSVDSLLEVHKKMPRELNLFYPYLREKYEKQSMTNARKKHGVGLINSSICKYLKKENDKVSSVHIEAGLNVLWNG
ncbi:hypothetical protein TNCV_1976181 [Trichonephila clavipes]|nr:hypothetical protein TNCV_1976181 [Trichonephila clavipes]